MCTRIKFQRYSIDVYVEGDYYVDGHVYNGKYWKNGTATALTNGKYSARALGIFLKKKTGGL